MAFEFRKFTDADKPKYDSLHLKNPLNTFQYPTYWAVDEERNALMVSFGGRGELEPSYGEPPDFYALAWQGHVIELEGHYKTIFPTKQTQEIFYEITRLVMPRELEQKIDIVNAMMSEAIQVYEEGRGFPTKAAHLKFIKLVLL